MTMARAFTLGRLIVTTCNQPAGAPFMDRGFTYTPDRRCWHCRVFLLAPWRRDRYGAHVAGRAFVIGWRQPHRVGPTVPMPPDAGGDFPC